MHILISTSIYFLYTLCSKSLRLCPNNWSRRLGGFMFCPKCSLDNQIEFSAEMMVHLGGIKNLDNSGVVLFPKILVCVSCGFSQFTVPKAELALLTVTPRIEPLTMAAAG